MGKDKSIVSVQMSAIRLKTASVSEQYFYKNIKSFDDETLIYQLQTDAMGQEVPDSIASASFSLPGTGSVVENITTVIDKAGLKDLSKWVKPTSNLRY